MQKGIKFIEKKILAVIDQLLCFQSVFATSDIS